MYIDLQEYKEFSKPAFTEDGLMVQFPRRVVGIRKAGNRFFVDLEAIECRKESLVISALMKGRTFAFTGSWKPMTLGISYIGNSTLRIQLWDGAEREEVPQPMLLQPPQAQSMALEEREEYYLLTASDLQVMVWKDPYCLEVKNGEGKTVYKQYNDDRHNVTHDRRRGHQEGQEDTAQDPSLSFPGFEVYPFGCVTTRDGRCCFTESVSVTPGESFYGFGERFSRLDKNGQELLNWVINPVGVSNSKSYKCVPFFYSSSGYGAYYNTPRRIRFSMCDYYFKAYECQVESNELDIFLFLGTEKQVLRAYADLTGHSAVPPKWAFGVWMSRNCYMTQDEVEQVARQLREQQLPCDVMHIDWAYCKTFDYDFAFDTTRFPDVPGMAKTLKDMGIRLSVWHLPYIKKTADIYDYAARQGYLATEPDGSIADTEAGEAVIDFSNPEAVKWYQSLLKGLLEQGIRVIKTDFGENAQDTYCYANVDGKDMHNLYPLYYNQAAYEICQKIHPGDSLVWGRSAYTGCQRFPVYWGGDADSDYNGMLHSLRGGLSFGQSGFPFWSHDVGGYFCTPDEDVYIRWLQFGMLSPLVRFHGTSAREPWAYSERAVDIYKKYAALRYSLMEYIYSEAFHCAESGLPMLRALVLEYLEDPMTRQIEDEYLLGSSLLVAPVFSNEDSRTVYFPRGNDWVCAESGKIYAGGSSARVEAPIDVIPVFYRCGSAIPFVKPAQHTEEIGSELQWKIVLQDGKAEYLYTDGNQKFQLSCTERNDGFYIETTESDKEQSFCVVSPNNKPIYHNGKKVDT